MCFSLHSSFLYSQYYKNILRLLQMADDKKKEDFVLLQLDHLLEKGK